MIGVIHLWDEDALEPRAGYMVVADPYALVPVTDPETLRVLPKSRNSVRCHSGDLLQVLIISAGERLPESQVGAEANALGVEPTRTLHSGVRRRLHEYLDEMLDRYEFGSEAYEVGGEGERRRITWDFEGLVLGLTAVHEHA